MTEVRSRMPTVFLPHGGGPWPFVSESAFGKTGMWDRMRSYLEGFNQVPPEPPKAILVVSAHWEETVPTIQGAPHPPLLYDYYGFEPQAYEVEWPAPGATEVAEATRGYLEAAGISAKMDLKRGFDHGVFVPLKLAYPRADVPTFQLSLRSDLDPDAHLQIGRALAPLRDLGVFIVGSGMSYHNLVTIRAHLGGRPTNIAQESQVFDEWLVESMAAESHERTERLRSWTMAPFARESHPREEHLLPLMVVVGAAGDDIASCPYHDEVMGAHVSAFHFAADTVETA